MPEILLAEGGKSRFRLEVRGDMDAVTGNAVSLLREELQAKYGIQEAASMPSCILEIDCRPDTGLDEQAFRLKTVPGRDGDRLVVSGGGSRGVLYGICEVLDSVGSRGQSILLPFFDLVSAPDIRRRGVERHWPPLLSTPRGVEENKLLIRALARRRINSLMWLDNWIGQCWYSFLDFRHYPELRDDGQAESIAEAKECLGQVIAEARNWGMDFYLPCTEFNVPRRLLEISPEIFYTHPQSGYPVLRLEQEGTWRFHQAKIREVMEDFPLLAGIELWTGEAMEIWQCHLPKTDTRSVGQRLLLLYDRTLEAMDAAGRPDARLICSTFNHHPEGERIYEDIMGRLPERCEARTKMQVEDFHRFNSPTSLADRVTPGREWIEFDIGGEYRGDWIGWISCALDFIPQRMRHYRERGIDSFICRIRGISPRLNADDDGQGPLSAAFSLGSAFFAAGKGRRPQDEERGLGDVRALEGLASIKYDVYFSVCWDLKADLEEIWTKKKRPGHPQEMLEFFRLSETVAEKALYVGRCLVNNFHSTFVPSTERYEWQAGYIDFPCNYDCQERRGILEPTEENLGLIIAEKREAVEAAARMQEILERCRAELPGNDYRILKSCLDYQEQCVRTFAVHTEMYFRYRLLMLTTLPDRYLSLLECMGRCEAEIAKLRGFDAVQADSALALVGDIRGRLSADMMKHYHLLRPEGIIEA